MRIAISRLIPSRPRYIIIAFSPSSRSLGLVLSSRIPLMNASRQSSRPPPSRQSSRPYLFASLLRLTLASRPILAITIANHLVHLAVLPSSIPPIHGIEIDARSVDNTNNENANTHHLSPHPAPRRANRNAGIERPRHRKKRKRRSNRLPRFSTHPSRERQDERDG